uniref:Uncharacterized protein n=1 Tax=Propithecus coquereli TaxID=379532 RepID=A0A2K6GXK7_PROCO
MKFFVLALILALMVSMTRADSSSSEEKILGSVNNYY